MWNICTMGCYSDVKNDIEKFAGKWMKLENIILGEIAQTWKDKYGMYSLTGGY